MPSVFMTFFTWRTQVVMLLGFSSGIPLGLTGNTLQAWMKTAGVDLTLIGVFSLVGLPYTLKFVWSPFMDRFVPPLLGRRRGWALLGQLGVMVCVAGMAFTDPLNHPGLMAVLALLVAFSSATQDIAADAYRTEILLPNELGPGSSLYITGYRVAMIVSGAVAMIMADFMSWRMVYLIMAGAMLVGVVTMLLAPEPKLNVRPPQTLADAVVQPFVEFFRRPGAIEILLFILIYKLDVAIAQSMSTPFVLDMGFSMMEVGTITKGVGVVATIVGAMIGGGLMVRLGMCRSLWLFGLLQGVSGLCFTGLAIAGKDYTMLVAAIAAENACAGMGTAAFTGFIMSICDKRFTATQYALLTSFMAVTRVVAGVPTGWMAKAVGWPMFFVISMVVAIPGLLMLLRYNAWMSRRPVLVTDTA